MHKLLKNKRGEAYIGACVIIIVFMMIFSSLFYYTMAVVQAKGQRKEAMQLLDAYTQENAQEIYNSIKLQNDGTADVYTDKYKQKLCDATGLTEEDGVLVSISQQGIYRYKISNIEMSFVVEESTQIRVDYVLTVPLIIVGKTQWVDIPITIYTSFNPKFEPSTEGGSL